MSAATCTRPLPSLFSLSLHETSTARRHVQLSLLKPRGQVRTQASTRRMTKRLRNFPGTTAPNPHPSAVTHLPETPARRNTFQRPVNPAASTITFNPPPSAPTPYHTPAIFLPPNDPRRQTLTRSHAVSNPHAANPSSRLPPAVRKPYEKVYHLTAEQIAEMRNLRLSDPKRWTRGALAAKYGCTEFFAGIAAPAPEAVRDAHLERYEEAKSRWGPKRSKARQDRAKRRDLWARDA